MPLGGTSRYVSGVSNELEALLEKTRGRVLSPEERERQVRSFAFGNLSVEEPDFDRVTIDTVADAHERVVQRGLAGRRQG